MSRRRGWLLVACIAFASLGATAVAGAAAWQQRHQSVTPGVPVTTTDSLATSGDRIVFRNTAIGTHYGLVATVPLSEPGGTRSVSSTACDRVDADARRLVCLHTERGVIPSYTATLLTYDGSLVAQWPLPGIPSRARFSPDGALVAATAFVTGHAYAAAGFSTETVIRTSAGASLGSLEDWELIVDGAPSAPVDRNFWGVTFADDDTFYATVAFTATGQTYLVQGDVSARTLATIAPDVECPSLSPDGTRVAFKRLTSGQGATAHWTPAIMDLSTQDVQLLPETRSIDDQIAWLDDTTIMYGMPRPDEPGDTDVWALQVGDGSEPRLLIEHAWSPAVVRE